MEKFKTPHFCLKGTLFNPYSPNQFSSVRNHCQTFSDRPNGSWLVGNGFLDEEKMSYQGSYFTKSPENGKNVRQIKVNTLMILANKQIHNKLLRFYILLVSEKHIFNTLFWKRFFPKNVPNFCGLLKIPFQWNFFNNIFLLVQGPH